MATKYDERLAGETKAAREAADANGARPGPHKGVLVGGPDAYEKKRDYIIQAVTKNVGSIAAIVWMFMVGSGWIEWTGFAVLYVYCMLAVSIGYHRYFTHKSFETSKTFRYILGISAQIAALGSLRKWVIDHRRHHARADRVGDTHSPYLDSYGKPMGRIKGLVNSQVGWLLDDTVTCPKMYGKGVMDDEVMNFAHRTRWHWYFVSLFVLPALWAVVLGGLTGTLTANLVIGTILIAGFLRLNVVLHAVLAINSFGHSFGYERFEGHHSAKNNWVLGILTMGEGWHNNHHQHPRSAYSGLRWYEIDVSSYVIWLWSKIGLVWNVKGNPKYYRDEAGQLKRVSREVAMKRALADIDSDW